ncbi:MAG: MaoC/PaaZ C-terminal domain-containing protein [Alphaproteobacteria bacterium]
MKAGDTLPELTRHVTPDLMMAYGAATWDWHRMHYDQAYAHRIGLPDPVLDGQSQGAFFAMQAMDWAGPQGFVTGLSFRMRAMVFPGDSFVVSGTVESVEDGVATLTQELKVGDRLCGTATTTVRIG